VQAIAAGPLLLLETGGQASKSLSSADTVLGRVAASQLGMTLMHEHVLVDFIGAAQVSRDRYDPREVFTSVLPHLRRLYGAGCRTLVECTPAFIGRDPALLASLSEASKLNLITNTGYYGAADDNFIPAWAYQEPATQLADRWVKEYEEGIEGTGIKPGIIKIGVDAGRLSKIDEKLVKAAALTHLHTGLTIASHTGDGIAALEQLDLLKKLGVRPNAFIWVHAHNEPNCELQFQAAAQGCWVEFDGISPASMDLHQELIRNMVDRKLIHRTLISQDAGWYHVGEPGGGEFRSYDFLFNRFLPELRKRGISESSIQQLLVGNPRQVLTVKIRALDKHK
jgi:predicted metal-dependent phosphotriesterase family hydrolase